MIKKSASQVAFFLLIAALLTCTLNIQPVHAPGTIYIRADGSIDPSTSSIQRNVNVYTFTDNIDGPIIVQRNNVVINGAGHTLQGTGAETGIDLSSRTNVTIQNMVIKTFDAALYLYSSNQITISGTNISDSTDGIRVSDSSNNSIYENNITGNSYEGIYILASSNNAISENNITANTGDGVYLWGSSNNTIFQNNISNNWWGITSYYSTNNKIFHNNFINNPSQAYIESSVDIWDDGYPSGGNYWNDYVGVDAKNGPSQDHLGSDGIGDTHYAIDTANIDNYPFMGTWTPPDIAATNLTTSKCVVGQGYTLRLNGTFLNQGNKVEGFTVSFYANSTAIASQPVILLMENSTVIPFAWNTTGFAYGNHTVSAYAWPVQGETHTEDNTFVNGWVIIAMVGDLTGPAGWPDGKCDVRDVAMVARLFGVVYPDPSYHPNCDINDDLKIDVKDVAIVAKNYGRTRP